MKNTFAPQVQTIFKNAMTVMEQAREWEQNPDAPAPDFSLLPFVKRVGFSKAKFDRTIGTIREEAVTLWTVENGLTGEKPFEHGVYTVITDFNGEERHYGLYGGYFDFWLPRWLFKEFFGQEQPATV